MSCSSGPKIITEGLVFNLDPSNSKSYPAKDDPYRNDVSLLLDFDEGFIDKSKNNTSFTTTGTPSITTNSKYGSGAGSFNGSNSYIEPSLNTTTSFGTGDFTIEFWFYTNSTTNQQNILDKIGSANRAIYMAAGGQLRYYNGSIDAITGATLSANTWYHISLVKISSVTKLYLNGSQTGSNYNDSLTYSTSNVRIGAAFNNTCYVDGRIDDLRITVGIGRYSATFTPPDRLTALPARAYDLRNDATATLTSGPIFSNVQNGVISFDGTDDYVTFSTNNNYALGSGDFTVEFLVNLNSSHQFSLIDFRINETNPNGNAFVIGTNASNQWVVYKGANQITGDTSVARTWNHIVVTRVGTSIRLYIDGVQSGSTWTSSDNFTDNALLIGTDYPKNARFFNGKFSYLRIYKGKGFSSNDVALNYAAVRQKFTEIPRTFSGLAVWFDGADLSTLRQNSNATTAATLNSDPVGYWADKSGNGRNATQATAGNRAALKNGTRNLDPAVYFNGSQWLSVTTPGVDFGTGDFTIECWIKSLDTSVLKTPVGTLTSGFDGGWQLLQNNSKFGFGIGVGGGVETYDATITQGVWYNFAVCRKGSTLKTFLNGVNGSTITNSSNISQTGTMNIGWANESAQTGRRFNGEIQNLIIYKGFCKYF